MSSDILFIFQTQDISDYTLEDFVAFHLQIWFKYVNVSNRQDTLRLCNHSELILQVPQLSDSEAIFQNGHDRPRSGESIWAIKNSHHIRHCLHNRGGRYLFLVKKNRELHHRRRHRRDRGLEPRCNVGVVRVRPPVDRGYMIYESLKWSMLSRSQRPSLKTLQSSQEVIKLCL